MFIWLKISEGTILVIWNINLKLPTFSRPLDDLPLRIAVETIGPDKNFRIILYFSNDIEEHDTEIYLRKVLDQYI